VYINENWARIHINPDGAIYVSVQNVKAFSSSKVLRSSLIDLLMKYKRANLVTPQVNLSKAKSQRETSVYILKQREVTSRIPAFLQEGEFLMTQMKFIPPDPATIKLRVNETKGRLCLVGGDGERMMEFMRIKTFPSVPAEVDELTNIGISEVDAYWLTQKL
jgi:hypothetical protein